MKKKIRYFEVEFVNKNERLVFNDRVTKKIFKKTKHGAIQYYNYDKTDPLVSVLNNFYQNVVEKTFDFSSLKLNYVIVSILESLLLKNTLEFNFVQNKN